MPIVRVESSIAVPDNRREAVLRDIAACIVRHLDVHPRQVRARLEHVPPETALVGETLADAGSPWLVAWVAILEGRPESKRIAFIDDFAGTLASAYGVADGSVRVLVQEYPKVHWSIGRQTAAALGR
jgi:phenylpyruvate tautomerase PptA (4-oxalocrotonate tautomerase family)